MAAERKLYFIQEHLQEVYFNGGICNVDIEKVLLEEGAKTIHFPYHYNFSLKAKLFRFLYLVRILFTLPTGAVVAFQYPQYAGMNKLLLRCLRWRRSVDVIIILAEINGLKYADDNLLRQEIKYFKGWRYFIVHNQPMQRWLHENVPGRTSAMLNFFDYLTRPADKDRLFDRTIAYAGNLSESDFIEKLPLIFNASARDTLYLYGLPDPVNIALSDKIVYKGVVEPYILPATIEGAWGLVWDGDAVDGIAGSFGHYMQYISHHKVSLYILAKMPIITYEHAGTAYLVKQYNIGITIKDLTELEEALGKVTPGQYRQMCENTKSLAADIATGNCLRNALHEIMGKIQAAK